MSQAERRCPSRAARARGALADRRAGRPAADRRWCAELGARDRAATACAAAARVERTLGEDLAAADRLGSTPSASSRRRRARGSGSSSRATTSGRPGWTTWRCAPHLHERGGVPIGLWCRGPLRLDEAVRSGRGGGRARVRPRPTAPTVAGDIAGGARPGSRGPWSPGRPSASTRRRTAVRWPAAAPTVAVLACGVDRAYPSAHRALIDYIAEVGLVVSEAAPGCAPTRIRFLARNRLIAALARGTVVVEAAVRSGALNTASWAAGLGRTVMGVPGPVTSAPSAGRAPADPGARRGARHLGRGGARDRGSDRAATSWPTRASPSGPATGCPPRQRQVLDAVPGAPARRRDRSPGRPAGSRRAAPRRTSLAPAPAGLVEHVAGRLAAGRGRHELSRRAATSRPRLRRRAPAGFVG